MHAFVDAIFVRSLTLLAWPLSIHLMRLSQVRYIFKRRLFIQSVIFTVIIAGVGNVYLIRTCNSIEKSATCQNDTTAQIQTKIVAFDRISMGFFIKFWREMEIKHDNND